MIEVVKPGLLTTIQDLGRPGYAHLGVPRSGALDRPSLILANRLLGNPDDAAALETTLTGVTLRAEVPTTVAVTGAPAPVYVDGRPVEFAKAVRLAAGSVLEVKNALSGVRSYVAFAKGGVRVAAVLGSRATDTLSGLGPPPLRAGFVFPVRPDHGESSAAGGQDTNSSIDEEIDAGLGARAGAGRTGTQTGTDADTGTGARTDTRTDTGTDAEITLRVRLGPRHDWFSVSARDALVETPYTVTVKSNRVGVRLSGRPLTREKAGELPSEGIVLGAIQVPADGQPVVFLADHPTTGGYPVIGVVEEADLPLLAQARPGTRVRFEAWT